MKRRREPTVCGGAAALLTVFSAALYSLSFPPASLWPLAWLSLAPWFIASIRSTPLRAFGLGLLWGVGITIGVGTALPGLFSAYFGWNALAVWVGSALVATLLCGIYYGAFSFWLSWLARRGRARPWLVAAGWGCCELARARLLIANPWGLAIYSQVPQPILVQIADISGPYGVGMLIAAGNAILADLCVGGVQRPRSTRSLAAFAGMLAAVLFYGAWRLEQEMAPNEPTRVAIIQGAVERERAWRPEYQQLGLGRYLDLTDRALEGQPQVVIWPENAVSFYPHEHSDESVMLLARSQAIAAELILGAPHYEHPGESVVYHNSVFHLRAGRIVGRYDKQRLVPIAEAPLLGFPADQPMHYVAVQEGQLLETAMGRVGAFICFEAMYPNLVRVLAGAGAEVLVNISNDSWFGNVSAARQHLNMAALRAVENRRYLIRAASSGFSAVIDPAGRIRSATDFGRREVLLAEVRPTRISTVYTRWGDFAAWLAVGFTAFMTTRAGLIGVASSRGRSP